MSLLQPTSNQFLVFILVLTRLSPLVMLAPVLGSRSVPMRMRALLAIGMALIVAPVYWGTPVEAPGNVINLALMAGREAFLGLAFAVAVLILVAGLQLAGQIIGQMSGMSLANVFNPGLDTNVPVFSQLFDLVTLAVFVMIGGHRQLVAALLKTFAWVPPGQATFSSDVVQALMEVTSQSFMLGIRAAAPIMIALMLAVIIMGLISRTLPQLNVLAVGLSFNAVVVLATLSITLGAAAWVFQDEATAAIDTISGAVRSSLAVRGEG